MPSISATLQPHLHRLRLPWELGWPWCFRTVLQNGWTPGESYQEGSTKCAWVARCLKMFDEASSWVFSQLNIVKQVRHHYMFMSSALLTCGEKPHCHMFPDETSTPTRCSKYSPSTRCTSHPLNSLGKKVVLAEWNGTAAIEQVSNIVSLSPRFTSYKWIQMVRTLQLLSWTWCPCPNLQTFCNAHHHNLYHPIPS